MDFGAMRRTYTRLFEHKIDVGGQQRPYPVQSRMRYHLHPVPRLDPPHTWIGAFAFLGRYPPVQQLYSNAAKKLSRRLAAPTLLTAFGPREERVQFVDGILLQTRQHV